MKFIKATKRIAAVAASGLIAASAVSAAGLGSYPSNFVQDGEFVGNVVIGTGTGAADSAAALSVIDDLKADLSEDSEQVRITYRESGDGTSVSAVDDRDALNYGENLVDVKADLDYEASDLLEDGDVDNHVYTQELFLENGEFSYRVFDEVDEEKAMAGLYYDAGEAFMNYTLEFDEVLDVATDEDAEALIGEELIIMGNEFTIVEIADVDITLIGGANKVSLGEGESTKVTVDGNSYDISIQSVADDKVLLTVNGQTDSINIYETEELAGVSIAVTDLVSSSRDAVKGYSEIVIGGQKVQLSNSGVEINDEDVEDIYPDYEIDVEMTDDETDKFEGFTITYRVDQDTLLKEGDYLEDVLFDAFSLSFDGVNEPDYNEYKITSDSEEIKFSGFVTHDGNALPSEFMLITNETADAPLYLGDDDTRIFFNGSQFAGTDDATATDALTLDGAMEGVDVDFAAGDIVLDLGVASSDVDEVMFFQSISKDEYYLFDLTSVNDNDVEADFKDLLSGKSVWNGLDIEELEDGDLEETDFINTTVDVNETTLDISELGSEMLLENGLVMNFAAAEDAAFDDASGAKLAFRYDAAEIDPEDVNDDDATFDIEMVRDTADIEDPIELTFTGSTDDWFSTELEEDSDFDVYVDHYGTMVTIDTDDKDDVTIAVPEEEVEGSVSVVFGEAGSTNTVTVAADNVEAKKAELEADGYTIVSTEDVESVSADVDIDAPILDTDVTSVEDAIVVGGPAVNSAARELLGISAWDAANPVGEVTESGDYIIKYYEDSNSVLVYGWTAADTAAAAAKLNAGGLSGDEYTN